MSKITEHVGNLIGTDELTEAISYLRNVLRNSPKLDQILIQSGRLTDLMQQIRIGTVNYEQANLTKNQIRFGILDLIREIDTISESNPDILKDFEGQQNIPTLIQNHTGSGDNVGRDQIISHQYTKP